MGGRGGRQLYARAVQGRALDVSVEQRCAHFPTMTNTLGLESGGVYANCRERLMGGRGGQTWSVGLDVSSAGTSSHWSALLPCLTHASSPKTFGEAMEQLLLPGLRPACDCTLCKGGTPSQVPPAFLSRTLMLLPSRLARLWRSSSCPAWWRWALCVVASRRRLTTRVLTCS